MRFALVAIVLLGACSPDAEPVGMLYADPGVVDLTGALPQDAGMASPVVVANVGLHCISVDALALEGESADLLSLASPTVPLVLDPSAVVHIDVIPRILPIPVGLPDAVLVVTGEVGDLVEGVCVLPEESPKPIELRVPIVLATPAACDKDEDGAFIEQCGGLDCDDEDATVFPGAEEICNGKDDDCDTVVDGPDATGALDWYADTDADTYGDALAILRACEVPDGYVADDTDCDDTDEGIFPGAVEICDGLDQDCDLDVDEGFTRFDFHADTDADTYGDPLVSTRACVAPPGMVSNATDCDDTDETVHPLADEFCDEIDQDCDGEVADDESLDALPWHEDVDGDQYGATAVFVFACEAPPGWILRSRDCNDADATIHPNAPEICDGIDQDCDTVADDDPVDGDAWYPDVDGDTFGDDALVEMSCAPIPGSIAVGGDCDDSDPDVHPGQAETCNTVDEDCDALIDEDPGICGCPIQNFDGHAYGFCNVTLTWQIANFACSLNGYDLVKIDDAAEDAFVTAAAVSYNANPWWTGYADGASEGTWVWTDGTTGTYENWAPGEPQGGNNNADCMQIGSPNGWADSTCGNFDLKRFVCEGGP